MLVEELLCCGALIRQRSMKEAVNCKVTRSTGAPPTAIQCLGFMLIFREYSSSLVDYKARIGNVESFSTAWNMKIYFMPFSLN